MQRPFDPSVIIYILPFLSTVTSVCVLENFTFIGLKSDFNQSISSILTEYGNMIKITRSIARLFKGSVCVISRELEPRSFKTSA